MWNFFYIIYFYCSISLYNLNYLCHKNSPKNIVSYYHSRSYETKRSDMNFPAYGIYKQNGNNAPHPDKSYKFPMQYPVTYVGW